MDGLVRAALEPGDKGLLLRYGRWLLPGVQTTVDQIDAYGDYWRAEADAAFGSNRPTLIALGDSLAQGIGASSPALSYVGRIRHALGAQLSTNGQPPPVLNLSRSGATIEDVLDLQLPALGTAPVDARWVVCTVGSNDLVGSPRPMRARKSLTRLIEQLPGQAVVATLPARGSLLAKMVNSHIRSEAARLGVATADVDARLDSWRGRQAADRFHPNDAGYQLWAGAFMSQITDRR